MAVAGDRALKYYRDWKKAKPLLLEVQELMLEDRIPVNHLYGQGDKKLLEAKEAKYYNLPRFDEISVADLYDQCLLLDYMVDHILDEY